VVLASQVITPAMNSTVSVY